MRTSGGAGASSRRLRDATPGALHPLPFLLLYLLLLCSLVVAESATETAQPHQEQSAQHQLQTHVTVGADGLAASRGAGRRRSDGLSITRSIPVETSIASDAAVDDQAIKFTPSRVDLGRMETCSPQRYYVAIENRGQVSVRLDGADFTHEGFSLANDVRGIRLDPGDRFNVQFVFLPREVEPNGVDAHLRVLTTSGLFALPISSPQVAMNRYGVSAVRASIPAGARFEQSLEFVNPFDYTIRITEMFALDGVVHLELLNGSEWIGPRWPREGDGEESKEEVHGEYDQEFDYARRAHRGAWDMPPRTTNPLIKVSLQTYTPGVYFTYIHIAAGERRLLLVPVRITVLKLGIHIEPKELDLGVLTDYYEDKPLELYFSLYNTGLNPIEVVDLKVLESDMIVSAQLRGSTVIPPQTRVYHALAVQLRVNREYASGTCIASLLLKSNASSSELGQRKLRLYGQVVKGHLEFQLNETLIEVITPLHNVFNDGENVEDNDEKEKSAERLEEDQEAQTIRLVSLSQNNSMGILAGTKEFRKLRLWNQFDRPLELQHVWIQSALSQQDTPHEVVVHKFKQRVVPAGAAWPKISLQITPSLLDTADFLAPRVYSLMIETNATLHRIQIHFYHSILSVSSTRGLQNYFDSGYFNSTSQKQGSSQLCSRVPKDGIIATMTPRIDREGLADNQAVQICRSLLLDLGKLASHRARTGVVSVRNKNPVSLELKIMATPKNESVQIFIRAEVLPGIGKSPIVSDTKSTNDTTVISVGDIFLLEPGYQVNFFVEVQAEGTLGEITIPVMSMATPIELLHLYAHILSVQGTIEPVTPAIVLPSMFPGRTEIIHLEYRNTFEHSVTPLLATTSSTKLKLLFMRNAMAPQQVEKVLDLLFSPAADLKCSNAMFLADCLLPPPPNLGDQTCEQLSDYGQFVDAHDLAALNRRDAFWNGTRASEKRATVEAQVQLQTDIMDDVANVTIRALLERPLVTVAPEISASNNSLNIQHRAFALTELLALSEIFVDVRNPSNISIQMELTIAAADQDLFYSCDQESRTTEISEDVEHREPHTPEEFLAWCLVEWGTIAYDAADQLHDKNVEGFVPPFYFQKKIVQVPPGEQTRLGPIYYLPYKVQEITTTVFVRNDLSHIEPVPLLARSGKGTLKLLVEDDSNLMQGFDGTKKFTSYADHDQSTGNTHDGLITFALSEVDAPTDYSRSTKISLSNTGPFDLTIYRVEIQGKDDASIVSSTEESNAATASGFWLTSEHLRQLIDNSEQEEDNDVVLVLPPGKTAHFSVSFSASCVAVDVTSWLVIDTSDSVKRIRLYGTITTDAAFSCLRSRMLPPLSFAFYIAWVLAVVVAVISIVHTLLVMVHDAWTSGDMRKAQPVRIGVNPDPLVLQSENQHTSGTLNAEGGVLPSRTLASIYRALEEMEQVAFNPPARVVTPAVAALLEQRHKGLCSTGRSSLPVEDIQPTKSQEGAEGGDKTTAPEIKVQANNSKASVSDVEAEQIPQSDVTSTTTEPSLHEVQETVGETDNAASKAQSAIIRHVKSVEAEDDLECSDSSLEDGDTETPEDLLSSSSQSTIAQSDTGESSRSVDLPKLMVTSPCDDLMPDTGSNLPTSASLSSHKKVDDPFEAFKSLSERWRAQDWQENLGAPPSTSLSGKFRGIEEDWDSSLSLSALVGATASNQHDENAGSSRRSTSGSFIGAGSGLYLDGFSTFAAPTAGEAAGAAALSAKKAPPGFTPADAKPLETRAAFERLRGSDTLSASSSSGSFGGSSLFASKLPLFGPALPPSSDDRVLLGGVGRIGSGRSNMLIPPLETTTEEGESGRRRMNIGGRHLPSHARS